MKKIIFSDLDGTLLNDEKRVSAGNAQAIREATQAGHSFVIATGRPFESAVKISDELGLSGEGCYMVSYNGGHVYDCHKKEVLFSSRLSMDIVRELFARARAAGLYIHTYENGEILTEADTPELRWYASRTNLTPHPCVKVPDCLEHEPHKAIVIHLSDHERLERFRREQESWAKDRCRMIFSSQQYLEVVPVGISKQRGIRFLSELLGVSPEQTIAIGDEMNDCEMVCEAGIGAAVKNANPQLKKLADYVTEADNNGDAVAEVIRRFVL